MQKLTLYLCLLLALNAYSQRERIFVDFSKYRCNAGDSIFIKGYALKGAYPSTKSTTVFLQLYDSSHLVSTYVFPLFHGQFIGQIIVPDTLTTGAYYATAFTRQQWNLDSTDAFSVPIEVYNRQRPGQISHRRKIASSSSATSGKIKGIRWITTVGRDSVTSLLQVDSIDKPRQLHLARPVSKNAAYAVSLQLSPAMKEAYAQLPVDTDEDHTWLLLYEDSVLLGRQYLHLNYEPQEVLLRTDTFSTSPLGYNSWQVSIPDDSAKFFTSITVSDEDRSAPIPRSILELENSYTDDLSITDSLADTSFISFAGKALKASGNKHLANEELTMAGIQNNKYLFTESIKVDSAGQFVLDSLLFFGNLDIQFQVNRRKDRDTKNVRLELTRSAPPKLSPSLFLADWEEYVQGMPAADVEVVDDVQGTDNFPKIKTLQAVEVKDWKDQRKELDAQYATGFFAEPALYVYDLRYVETYDQTVPVYLDAKGGRLHYDIIKDSLRDVMGHPIHYFVDEREFEPYMIKTIKVDKLAYIKILESDFLTVRRPEITIIKDTINKGPLHVAEQITPLNVCMYTKKDEDFRFMPGGLNKLTVKGYDDILPFHPDRNTLFYDAVQSGNHFHIQFHNSTSTKSFRLKIEGISYNGKLLHYEAILSKPITENASQTVLKRP